MQLSTNEQAVLDLGRCSGDHMRGKMITDSWYLTIEYVDSWQRCVNRSKLERLKYNEW